MLTMVDRENNGSQSQGIFHELITIRIYNFPFHTSFNVLSGFDDTVEFECTDF